MLKYKLTTQDLTTYRDFQWEIGKKVTRSGNGELCSVGWLHYYHHPVLAVMLNSIHGWIDDPKLFEVEANGVHKDDNGLKGGCTEITLIREIELPEVTTIQRVAFGILCAKEVCKDKHWNEWADNWLNGTDRANYAYYAANYYATKDPYYAIKAASAATDTNYTAYVEAAAAYAAASAADDSTAAEDSNTIDFITIVEKAMTYS